MKKKLELSKKKIFIYIFIILVGFLGLYYFSIINYQSDDFHIHADFKVYINNSFVNFSLDKYQSEKQENYSQFLHLHDNNGEVIHFHEEGYTLSDFFKTLDIVYNQSCFIDEYNNSYCNNEDYTLKTFVNGVEIKNGYLYIAKDLDQIFIGFISKDDNIKDLLEEVSDKACIDSKKCPWRGAPSEGSCSSGSTCIVDINKLIEDGK